MENYIGINEFVKRQVPGSRFSYYNGTWDELLELCNNELNNPDGHLTTPTSGVAILRVSPVGFYTGLIEVNEKTYLEAKFIKRQENEDQFINVTAVGEHAPAKMVEIVLYSYDRLRLNDEQSTECNWEIICINAYPTDIASPMTPLTMARNFLDLEGGTKTEYTTEEFARSIIYWSNHVMVEPPA